MNQIQEIILNIANEIKRICEKFSLRYFLDYGSLLGAVRHKGFIPWDDDIDICMPRPDYEKFIKLCKSELNPQYALRCSQEKKYIYHFAKVDDKTTTLIENFNKAGGYKGGVYVDIFPLDGLPNGKIRQRRFIRKCRYLYRRANLALVDFSSKKYPLYKRVIISLFKHSNGKKFLFKLEHLLQKYDYDSAEWVSSDILQNNPIPKRIFNETTEYEFENSAFASVKNADEYLKRLYDNYMELPPNEKRVSNHFYTLDLNIPYANYHLEKENNDA